MVTLVERKSGFTAIGKIVRRAGGELNARLHRLIQRQPRRVRTITVDNGTEFHSYQALVTRISSVGLKVQEANSSPPRTSGLRSTADFAAAARGKNLCFVRSSAIPSVLYFFDFPALSRRRRISLSSSLVSSLPSSLLGRLRDERVVRRE